MIALLFGGVMMFLFLLVQVIISRVRLRRSGELVLEIRDGGLLERTNVYELLSRWAGLHKITSTPRDLYVYVTATRCHLIPKRFFASEEEAGAFENQIRQRIEAAQLAPAAQADTTPPHVHSE